MNAWLLKVGEPLPTDPGADRPHRMGLLARQLAERGHDVTWFCSTFDHARKRHRYPGNRTQAVTSGFRLVQLHGPPYQRNVSIARLRNHRAEAREFTSAAATLRRPDVVVCAYPTIDLAAAAVEYGIRQRVPVVLDVRDLWPDIFLDVIPRPLRLLGALALRPLARAKARAFAAAAAITGTSEGFVDWGVAAAGRSRGAGDVAFAHGYPAAPLAAVERDRALAFWRSRLGERLPERIVCFFGNFADHVLDLATVVAAARQPPLASTVTFVLCGDGPSHRRTASLAEGASNVVLPGRVDAAQIRVLMELSIAGVVPYTPRWDFEGNVPNKAIEYLSGGLPVLTCLTGELQRLVETHGCGSYYEAGSPDALAAAVLALVNDPARQREQAQAARRLFDAEFEASAVYARFAGHLERLAADAT